MAICNRDCFNCPYPGCINDTMEMADYRQSREIEREILFPASTKQRKIAQKNRKYYEANKEKIAQHKREYYEANKEKIAQYQREYRKRKKQNAV